MQVLKWEGQYCSMYCAGFGAGLYNQCAVGGAFAVVGPKRAFCCLRQCSQCSFHVSQSLSSSSEGVSTPDLWNAAFGDCLLSRLGETAGDAGSDALSGAESPVASADERCDVNEGLNESSSEGVAGPVRCAASPSRERVYVEPGDLADFDSQSSSSGAGRSVSGALQGEFEDSLLCLFELHAGRVSS